MTTEEQIKVLTRIGCEDAIQEIKCNGNSSLSSDRLDHHIEIAIGTGLVARVEGLVAIRSSPLSQPEVERLTKRCLQLEWIVDALSASKLGAISEQTRRELVEALVSRQMADNHEEALQLLDEGE